MAAVAPRRSSAGTFRHEAWLHNGPREFVERAVPFVREGVAAGEGVLVAVPRSTLRLLSAALGEDHSAELVEMERVGRNPGSIISVWHDFLGRQSAEGRAARGIGQPVWAGRTPMEVDECLIHESLLNVAFEPGPPWQLACPYDIRALEPATVGRALACHPDVWDDAGHRPSAGYKPAVAAELLTVPIAAEGAHATEVRFDAVSLRELRGFVARFAAGHGVRRRVDDLVLAVNELATNSIDHAGGEGTLRLWADGRSVVCEVRDRGHLGSPMIGQTRPALEREDGRGVWLVHQLCDLVQVRSSTDGTCVRIRMLIE